MDPNDVLSHCALNGTDDRGLFNRSCAEQTFAYFWDRPRFSGVETGVFSVFYLLLTLLAVAANCTVLCVIVRARRPPSVGASASHHRPLLSRRLQALIVNMAVSDLILAVCILPLLWVPSRTYHFPYGEFACKAANTLPAVNIYCCSLTLAAMAVDRYYSVRRASKGRAERGTDCGAWLCIGAIWCVALLLSSPLFFVYHLRLHPLLNQTILVSPGGVPQRYTIDLCRMQTGTSFGLQLVVTYQQVLFLYVLPVGVILFYNRQLSALIQRRQRLNAARRRQQQLLAQSSVSDSKGLATTSSTRGSCKQRRAVNILSLMAGSYALLWLPYTIMTLAHDLGYRGAAFSLVEWHVLDELSKIVSLLSLGVVNPYIYGFMNTNVRQELTRMMPRNRRRNNRHRTVTRKRSRSISELQQARRVSLRPEQAHLQRSVSQL